MKYSIAYDSPGRLRLRAGKWAFSENKEESVERFFTGVPGVYSAVASSANGGVLILYNGDARTAILEAAKSLSPDSLTETELSGMRLVDAQFKRDLAAIIKRRIVTKLFVPSFLRLPLAVYRAVPFVKKGLSSLLSGHMTVDVLDAVSISASILTGNTSTASSVMTLLSVSSLLEGYTKKKAHNAFSDSLALNIDKVWRVTGEGEELIPASNVRPGDVLRVRTGSVIPADGEIAAGTAEVNEASMTGESVPVSKSSGKKVFAGTVVESGTIDITVEHLASESRIAGIVSLIEDSESLKSSVGTKAERLADSLVPWCFAASAATYLLTGNGAKALSVLMVDFSCAVKLSTPVSVISAMREATGYDIVIKGGKYLENYALADTALFDKTGTLTVSCPTLVKTVPFMGYLEDEVLKISACLEEHFPHSVARAVVRAAEEKGLTHSEMHAEVEYIVAHGIASKINDKKVLIGSAHFIFDDEKVAYTPEEETVIRALGDEYSLIYLAVGGRLAGILCIKDPVRPNAAHALKMLSDSGIGNIVMITGDGETTAKSVCRELGIGKFYAKVLPEDKLNIVNSLKAEGHRVIMVGDGINDSPALAAADVSVAMRDASDIAREVADITLLTSDLSRLALLRDLSERLFARIRHNYRFIMLFNSTLIVLGMCGVIAPVTSALLHNLSTMAIVAKSMSRLLPEEAAEKEQKEEM